MLQAHLPQIRERGYDVLGVSSDPVDRCREVAERLMLEFPLVSDPDLELIRALGLVHEGALAPPGEASGIARPALLVFDREGKLVARRLTENWRQRAGADDVLELLDGVTNEGK